ncbi:MAG: selenocysteine-specific translation elongation factor [Burkholderiales bacterium]|nr:selenocysteine-specific translation elongation factor [Burkholderiales bacterium]
MIVGTAGHIDHGKTTLVKALTGVDTDRLPEEKARGVSIELGYAYLDLPGSDERIGFIDVPGHERLVHTMLAGATGIDHALLLVAADDGVMPQTREHLAVLSLLGLERGTVVVTKTDRADAARVAAVCAEAAALVEASALAGSPVLPVSAISGDGMAALRGRLIGAARDAATDPARASAGDAAFRLAIDRVFTLDGVGTIAAGTVHAGSVHLGAELRLVPGTHTVRVRSIHAQNRRVTVAHAGQRCALALAGVDRSEVERGQWLVAPFVARAADRIDLRLTLWQGETTALRSGTSVHVHLGAAQTMATVALLEPPVLAPGATGLAQLVLRAPIGAWHGDRIVLRDASATRTLAGASVLDPAAPVRYRRTPQRLAELQALTAATPEARLRALLAAAPLGLELRQFAAREGRVVEIPLADALRHHDAQGDWLWGHAHAQAARERVLEVLSAFHAQHPDELGPDSARLRRLVLPRLSEPLWVALLAAMRAEGCVSQRGAFVHRPEHGVQLSATEARLAQKLAAPLAAAGFEGAWVRDLARDGGEGEALVRLALARLAQQGELFQIVRDLYVPPATMARLTAIARELAAQDSGVVTAARFRDATGLGRKRAIQILEHLDRIGLLRRVGDEHRLRAESRLFVEGLR